MIWSQCCVLENSRLTPQGGFTHRRETSALCACFFYHRKIAPARAKIIFYRGKVAPARAKIIFILLINFGTFGAEKLLRFPQILTLK